MSVLVTKPAPDFKAEAVVDGQFTQVQLSDYKGKWVILYFYPKDMTPGCTVEACNFRDDFLDSGFVESIFVCDGLANIVSLFVGQFGPNVFEVGE